MFSLGLLVNSLGVKPLAVPGCTWSSSSLRKLRSLTDCLYKQSMCVGDSHSPYNLYYANARYFSASNTQLNCSELYLFRIPFSH